MRPFDDRVLNTKRYTELRDDEEEGFIQGLATQYGHPYINLQGVTINPSALRLIDESQAMRTGVAIFERQNRLLSVAIRNLNNPETKELLALLGKEWTVRIYLCSTRSLTHAWGRYKDQKETSAVKKGVLDIDPAEVVRLTKIFKLPEDIAGHIETIKTLNAARRISSTLEALFAGAIGFAASDIHIEPEEHKVRVRYRLDGVLHNIVDLEKGWSDRLISRLKLLAGVKLNIHDEAQDGRFTFDAGEKQVEIRTSVVPGASGESLVMRLLDPTVASFNLDQLGLNAIMDRVMRKELLRPNGMILTTGPTGSGKTTALYAFLRHVHTPEVKIITIEDPVEYKVENLIQTQVSEDYSFAQGLRAILRQDPEIIMVGEIRDREVAETAIHAAQTGHLVFSTLHTNSAAGAFPRLLDLGVDYHVIGTSINVILGQRLVRTLCSGCKKPRPATAEERELIMSVLAGHPAPPPLADPLIIYDPVGCEACKHTGFHGRQGVYEAILMDKAVEEALIRDSREHIIVEAARPQGIPSMAEDGMEKVLAGVTSLEELTRVVDMAKIRGAVTPAPTDDDFHSHVI